MRNRRASTSLQCLRKRTAHHCRYRSECGEVGHIWDTRRRSGKQKPRFTGVLRADEGTRTLMHCNRPRRPYWASSAMVEPDRRGKMRLDQAESLSLGRKSGREFVSEQTTDEGPRRSPHRRASLLDRKLAPSSAQSDAGPCFKTQSRVATDEPKKRSRGSWLAAEVVGSLSVPTPRDDDIAKFSAYPIRTLGLLDAWAEQIDDRRVFSSGLRSAQPLRQTRCVA